MGKYLKKFELTSQYEEYINSTMALLPNVSFTEDEPKVYYNPKVLNYLRFIAIEDSTFNLTRNACEYSLDEGQTWTSLSAGTNTPIVYAGNKIMFKATNPTISVSYGIGTFSSTGKFNVEGNIMSLLYGDNFEEQIDLSGKDYVFSRLFYKCTNVVEAHNLILPATTLAHYCYELMFWNCTSLITAPELPATKLTINCYYGMFEICTSLVNAPELPATTLNRSCYESMFSSCTSLETAPKLPATTLATCCYTYMFYECTSLTTAPELPATTLAIRCYDCMFKNCTSLNYIKMLATDISATDCLSNWLYRVPGTGTFIKHKDMTSLPNGTSGIPIGWTVQDAA